MKIALVHDYLNEFGGAERVLLTLSEMYPKAPIYTIYKKNNSSAGKAFKDKKVVESWFGELPIPDKLISPLRFLIPLIWKSFDFSKYDLVITSAAWAVTKGMPGAKKEVCYLHTPPRYLWGYDTSRNWQNKWFSGLIKIYAIFVNHFMRNYDFTQAQKVDFFIANSKNVGKRIEKFYRRKDHKVVYPPINIPKNTNYLSAQSDELLATNYYLTGGRLVASKNFDLIIKASKKANAKLKIFGTGVEENNLKKIAKNNIEFLGRVSDKELASLYVNAKAFIVAQKDEDFGMTPVEAASYGTPTIAYRAEGYLESVVDGKTGIFFDELTPESLSSAIKRIEDKKWNKTTIKNHAKKFSRERFEREIRQIVAKTVK